MWAGTSTAATSSSACNVHAAPARPEAAQEGKSVPKAPVPSVAEIRRIGQPDSVLKRRNAEHWTGLLYGRRVSPYLSRALLRAGVSANGATWLMIVIGLASGAVLSVQGVWPVVAAFVLVQLQMVLDCCDGEMARVTRKLSPAGVYLDRICHYTTEAALPVGLGVRCDGGWSHLGGWTMLGMLTAIPVLVLKSETDLVHVARASAGLPMAADDGTAEPGAKSLRSMRSLARNLPFYRVFIAIEFTIIGLVAVVVDVVAGDTTGSRWWLG